MTLRLGLGCALVLGCALAACRGASTSALPPAAPPASAETKAAAPVAGAMPLPTVSPLLDDPRLAAARAFERAKDWASAAKAVHDARPADLPPPQACAWDFLEGRLSALANLTPDALAAFERAEAPACVLSGHAKLRSAQALARLGRADDAIARARAVPEDHAAVQDDVKVVLAEALAAKGDRAAALPLWRQWLTANPYGSRWVDTSVRLANALVDGVDGAPDLHAKEAYDAATRVVVEAPKLADSSGATQARLRAVAVLRAKGETSITEALSDAERGRQAQAWLDQNEPTKAFDLAGSVVKGGTGTVACKAAITRANAAAKKTPKADLWNDAVSSCEKDLDLVTALYAGAKARAGKDPKLAIDWFAKVESLFPTHRLADDARFRAALLIGQGSDEGRADQAEQMLRTLPDAYPSGDMRTEALFRVALAKMQPGHESWETVKSALDRIVEITPEDRHWATAGRAEYFRARAALATGDTEGALQRWEHVVDRHPLSFYMLLSYARLAASDAPRAKRALETAVLRDREPNAKELRAFPSKVHAILETPAIARAVKLLEVGDLETARREVTTSGALGEGVDPEVVWSIGALYNQAGFYDAGHAFSRGRLSDHLDHYPEGKWRLPWETAYPRAYEPLLVRACEKYTLPKSIAWGIMREESSFIADVKSPANAYGLMQLIVPTARGVAIGTGYGSDEASLKKPEVSIEFGTKLLSSLRVQHKHDALAVGAYNGGSGAIGRWMNNRTSDELDLFVENVPYEETRNYIKRVLASVATYGYLYEKKAFEDTLAIPLRLGR